MSAQQGVDFAKGLNDIQDQFQTDSQARSDEYVEDLKEAQEKYAEGAPEVAEAADMFQKASQDFGKDMYAIGEKAMQDIKALYESTYGEGIDPIGGQKKATK